MCAAKRLLDYLGESEPLVGMSWFRGKGAPSVEEES